MTLTSPRAETAVARPPSFRLSGFRPQGLVGLTSLAGAAAILVGVRLPWVTTFGGLLSQSAAGTRNGSLLQVGAGLVAVAGLAQLLRPAVLLRWAIALLGFVLTAYAGYLLVQLYGLVGSTDSMALPGTGPGLFVVAAGAVLGFATIFAPMPHRSSGPGAGTPAKIPAGAGAPPLRWLLAPLRSPLRFPAAVLALVAAFAHVPVTREHLVEAPYIGGLFILLTASFTVLATVLLLSDSAAAWTALGVGCALAVVAFLVSRTLGLPQMSDDVGDWLNPIGLVSILTETATAALAGLALKGRTGRR
jgi:hypothetical protein